MLMLFEGQVDITRQEDRVGRWMDTRIRMKIVNLQKQMVASALSTDNAYFSTRA